MPEWPPAFEPIHFPLLGNSLIIGVVALLHIVLAGLGVGFMILAPMAEYAGATRPWLLDAARSMTRFTVVTYTASLVLAVMMADLFIGLFPLTNSHLFNRFRYPFYVAMIAFALQLFALYLYYHFWDVLRARRPRVHLALGVLAAALILVWVAVLDGMGSYMLTPTKTENAWGRLSNPTWGPLVVHRFLGNLVLAGYVVAGYAAWRLASARDGDMDYYLRLSRGGLLLGFVMLMIQPLSGFVYAQAISAAAPEAYERLTEGVYRPLTYLQFLLIGALFFGSHLWLTAADRTSPPGRWSSWGAGALALAMVVSVDRPDLRRVLGVALVTLSLWVLYRSRRLFVETEPSPERFRTPLMRHLSVGMAVIAVLTYVTMGTIRETARRPDTVRHLISLQDEARQPAIDREGQEAQPMISPDSTRPEP